MPKERVPTLNTDLHLSELADGVAKSFQNAKDLHAEASILRASGALSRALFLHQISLEECGKVDILGTWATSALSGASIDVKKVAAALASHRAKNYANAYMLPVEGDELNARTSNDWRRANEAFKSYQAKFHLDSNTAKNASLYVNLEGGAFSTPRESISDAMVESIAQLNARYLEIAEAKAKMILRWRTNPDVVKEMLSWLVVRMEELKSELPEDPMRALPALLQEMVERAKTGPYYEVATGKRDSSDNGDQEPPHEP